MATFRDVTADWGTLTGDPSVGQKVRYELDRSSFTADLIVDHGHTEDTIAADGTTSTSLWANLEGLVPSLYTVTFPKGDQYKFLLPAGDDPISLMTLLVEQSVPWQPPLLSDLIDAAIEGVYAAFANTSDPTLGDALVGYKGAEANAVGGTVHGKLNDLSAMLTQLHAQSQAGMASRMSALFRSQTTSPGVVLTRQTVVETSFSHDQIGAYMHLGGGYYWGFETRESEEIPGATIRFLQRHYLKMLVVILDDTVGVTFASPGTAWIESVDASGTSWGPEHKYRRISVTGATATFTTPAGTTRTGILYLATTNGGMAKVSIDGSLTAATKLPTAQQLVDAGKLLASALTTNGGTLNPTDRILDQYRGISPSHPNEFALFSDSLTAGAHTVVVTCTGYKNVASTDVRTYITAWFHGADTTTIATSGVYLQPLMDLQEASGVHEYAITARPEGTTTQIFLGGTHGYEGQTSFVVKLDGAVVTPVTGALAGGDEIQFIRTTYLTHPDLGSTHIAESVVTYTMSLRDGLHIEYDIQWLLDGSFGTSYTHMFLISKLFDRTSSAGLTDDYTLLANDGSFVGTSRTAAMWAWDADGEYATMLMVPEPSSDTLNWIYAPLYQFFVQDRDTVTNNKYYVRRSEPGTPEPMTPGLVWHGEAWYKFARFPQGAALVLSR